MAAGDQPAAVGTDRQRADGALVAFEGEGRRRLRLAEAIERPARRCCRGCRRSPAAVGADRQGTDGAPVPAQQKRLGLRLFRAPHASRVVVAGGDPPAAVGADGDRRRRRPPLRTGRQALRRRRSASSRLHQEQAVRSWLAVSIERLSGAKAMPVIESRWHSKATGSASRSRRSRSSTLSSWPPVASQRASGLTAMAVTAP